MEEIEEMGEIVDLVEMEATEAKVDLEETVELFLLAILLTMRSGLVRSCPLSQASEDPVRISLLFLAS